MAPTCGTWTATASSTLRAASASPASASTPEPVVPRHAKAGRATLSRHGRRPSDGEKVELCRRLSQLTFEPWDLGAGKVILTNSGSEAVEAALKTAWLATKRRGVLAFTGSYHGLGYGALTVTGRHLFRDPFTRSSPISRRSSPFPIASIARFGATPREPSTCPPDRLNTFLARTENVLKQGRHRSDPGRAGAGPRRRDRSAGLVSPALRSLADRAGALLIFDEIYTGFYRTGPRFACDRAVRPDLICLGKALTSGFPLAACVGRTKVMDDAWPESTGEALHTSTFLGNPLGCRMALESLELLEAGTGANAWKSSARISIPACATCARPRGAGAGRAASA